MPKDVCEYLYDLKWKTHCYNAFLLVSMYNDARPFLASTKRLQYIEGRVCTEDLKTNYSLSYDPIVVFFDQQTHAFAWSKTMKNIGND